MPSSSNTLWNAVVLRSGPGAREMLNAGVIVLFGEPVPDALSEICVVHTRGGRTPSAPTRPIVPGDVLTVAGTEFTVDEVGESANSNLSDLGHVVLYFNSPAQSLLPGAIKVSGPTPRVPVPGAIIAFKPR